MPERSELLEDVFISTLLGSSENNGGNSITIINKDLSGGVVAAGSNFFSEILQLAVEYERNGKLENGHFIIKLFSTAMTFVVGKTVGIYDKEMEIYSNVLPKMIKLLNENEHVMFPVSYKSIYPDVLVLEDLRKLEYKTVDRTKPLDYDHCVAAIKALAKFHGLSVKIQQSNPDVIKKVGNDSFLGIIEKEGIFDLSFDAFLSVIGEINDLKRHVDIVEGLRGTLIENCRESLKAKQDAFNVLNHGDYWLSNMMFKYDGNGKVEKVKMFDFQLTRWSSPAIDISFFVLTSMALDVFKEHFNDILLIYLENLNSALGGGGERYTLNELKQDFNKSGFFVLIVMSTILPVFMSPKEHAKESLDENRDPRPSFDLLKKMMIQGERYIECVRHWVPYLVENNCLSN